MIKFNDPTRGRLQNYVEKIEPGGDSKKLFRQSMHNLASNLSRTTSLPLLTIVQVLAKDAQRFFVDTHQFTEEFINMDISGMLIRQFMEELKLKHLGEPVDREAPAFKEVRANLAKFVGNYAERVKEEETVDSFINFYKAKYPGLNYYALFDKEIVDSWQSQMNLSAKKMSVDQDKINFERNPDNFILNHLFRHVISQDDKKKTIVDRESLEDLFGFIDDYNNGKLGPDRPRQYELERVYDILYAEFRRMKILGDNKGILPVEIVGDVRGDVRKAVPGVELKEEIPFFRDDFNFDRFFRKDFIPVIRKIKKRRIDKRKNLRNYDFLNVTPEGLAECVYPGESLDLFSKTASLLDDKEDYLFELRKSFNYLHNKGKKIGDIKMKKELGKELCEVRKLIGYIIKESLKRRDKTDPIHRDCVFFSEILECDDINKLFEWMVYPKRFIDNHPGYGRRDIQAIWHQSRTMLLMLLFFRNYTFDLPFSARYELRDDLENHFKSILSIDDRETRNLDVKFRLAMEVEDVSGISGHEQDAEEEKRFRYRIISERDKSMGKERLTELMNTTPDADFIAEIQGKSYRVYPVENKKFKEVTVTIPGRKKKPFRTKTLFYTGDDRLVHCKALEAYLSSVLRGKKTQDIERLSIITDETNDEEVRDFFYNSYGTNKPESISDNAENRKESISMSSSNPSANNALLQARKMKGEFYAVIAENGKKGIKHKRIGFEAQIFDFDDMLIYNLSDYSVSSHNSYYRPKREFENLFRYLFPPIIYGSRFAEYRLNGYTGHK